MPYDVTFTRLETQALYDLKGPQAALRDWAGDALPDFPNRPNSKTETGGAALMFIGPDHWILRAELDAEDALEAALRPADAPPEISIVRVSDTLAVFRITGPDAVEVLAIACPMDLHESCFGADAASFTEAFGLRSLVTHCKGGFDIAVEQSFGPMVADYLTRITT
ncbi:sarcosine oxidase subunit gamma [Yoonia sediminilitoris]|uniref:Sarcosine oxidase subunit gamma n=1 Tax=Yoonia sediminilitoris TaxID=1286148 RepID=A0A2T6KB53_9RHOB|nr:sarcosine oxidase subunit gamma [Yoonia sediminilitoris]PUB12053.1 sarcosine oxidase subunit gamma [Yoonia sediminilitoris]RCW92880.1 sarcosine oxidase subunit gamma [Yoonia sediminilitoris]